MSGKPAARLNDPTACPIPGHGSNPIVAGSADVLFDGLPAARMGDPTACGSALASAVIPTVLINGKPATTIGTVGSHGNVVVGGSGTVLIGTSGGGAAFTAPTPLTISGTFDRAFTLTTTDGKPVDGLSYHLVSASGLSRQGNTSTTGDTDSFSTGAKQEPITLYISGAD
ncbi:PAAR domain-containing protein [Pseudomonas sp. CC6-YY-74]|uniref:PAAR domain-containing protein n=1 Tax=Pseudomonas sp. CC6-YY-74 TaxID=1930532 RepID=UPI0009A1CA42|nr:PAAR domain-containing protein [Pseudomonas sp. CC6-YY-74]